MRQVTRLEAAQALLSAAWAVVTYAKAQVRYSMSPTSKNHTSLIAAAARRDVRVMRSNNLQRWINRGNR